MAEKVKLDVVFDDDFSAPAKKAGNASQDLAAQMARIERIAKGTSGALSRTEVKLNSMARSVGTASRSLTQFTRRSNLNAKTFASAWSVTATRVPSVMDRLGDSFVGLAGRSRLLRGGLVMAAGAANSMAARGITLTRAVGGINTAFERIAGGGFVRNLGARLSSFFTMALAGFAAVTAAAAAFFSVSVIQAGMLQQRATLALGAMAGNGAERFKDLQRIALETGNTIGDVFEGVQGFVRAGFDFSTAERLFKRLQDLSMVGVSGETLKRITLAVAQIKGAGKLQGDELRQLMETGLNVERVWDSIAKQMGITTDEAKKLKEQGKVGADVAIRAIEDAIAATTGAEVAGGARADFLSGTFAGAIARARALWSLFLTDVAAESGGAFTALEGVLRDIGNAAQAGTFDAYSKAIGDAFDAIGRAINVVWAAWQQLATGFGAVMADGGLEEIRKDLRGIFDDVDAEGAGFAFLQVGKAAALTTVLLVKLVAIGAEVGEQFSYASGILDDKFGPALKNVSVHMSTIEKIAKGIALAFGIIGIVLVGTTLLALSPLIALLGIVALALTAATAAAYGLIKAFEAISAAAGRAGTAISNAMGSGFGAATIGFGAMPGLPEMPALAGAGGFTGASMGMAAIERGGPSGAPAVVGGAQGMDLSGLASMFTTSGGGEGGGGEKTVNFDFSVNVEGDGASDVEAVWEQLRWRVRREVEVGIKNAGDM